MFADHEIHLAKNKEIKAKYRSLEEYKILKDDMILKSSYGQKLWNVYKLNLL